jgi:hypothetical protein
MAYQGTFFFRVDVTVASYVGETKTTKTYTFTNKSLKDSSSLTTYWPILRSIGEISFLAGEILPSVTAGSIEIDNSIGSFGTGRKFSDILQPGRGTVVEQAIKVYVAQAGNDSDTVNSWTQIASLLVSDWEAPAQGETLTFNTKPLKYDEKVVTLEVNRMMLGMENAPSSSLGRAVPLLIGDNPTVIPVRISADGATTAKYAVGTAFYQLLENNLSTITVYSKDDDDTWQVMNNGGTGAITDYSTAPITGSHTLNTYDGRAWKINQNGPSIVTGVQLRAKGNGTTGRVSTAYLDVFILQVDSSTWNIINEEVTKGSVALSNYDSLNNAGNSNFAINVSFEKPAVLTSGHYYYFCGWHVRGWAVNELSLNYNSTLTDELRQDRSDANTSNGSWKLLFFGINRPNHKFHEVTFSTTNHVNGYTSNGLTYSLLTLSQFTPDSGQSNPNFDTLPIAVTPIQGLVAYGGGATFDWPSSLIDLLSYTWNPITKSWAASNTWDINTLDSTHYSYLFAGPNANYRSRAARGVFDSKTTFLQVVTEVCRGTASRVGVLSTGLSFVYPWGVTVTPVADIPFADINALTWQQRDVSTVVNRCVINLGKNYLSPPRSFENADDTNASFLYSTDFSATNFTQVEFLTRESRVMYGNRDLGITNFPIYPYQANGGGYLGNSSSEGSILAEYYLTRFAKPLVYCSFIVPWHRYSGLRMFDVITFTTPAFPAYYGTDPDPRQSWVVDTGTTVTTVDVNAGYDMVQAQTYRGLIEGISYVMAMEHAPAIKLTVLVLQNYATDPT